MGPRSGKPREPSLSCGIEPERGRTRMAEPTMRHRCSRSTAPPMPSGRSATISTRAACEMITAGDCRSSGTGCARPGGRSARSGMEADCQSTGRTTRPTCAPSTISTTTVSDPFSRMRSWTRRRRPGTTRSPGGSSIFRTTHPRIRYRQPHKRPKSPRTTSQPRCPASRTCGSPAAATSQIPRSTSRERPAQRPSSAAWSVLTL